MNEQCAQQNQAQGYGRAALEGCSIGPGQLGDAYVCAKAPERPTIRATVDVPADEAFSDALRAAQRNGRKIARRGWNGAGQYVTCQWPDKGSKMTQPFMVLKNAQNEFVPWAPSQGDLFANDWAILP